MQRQIDKRDGLPRCTIAGGLTQEPPLVEGQGCQKCPTRSAHRWRKWRYRARHRHPGRSTQHEAPGLETPACSHGLERRRWPIRAPAGPTRAPSLWMMSPLFMNKDLACRYSYSAVGKSLSESARYSVLIKFGASVSATVRSSPFCAILTLLSRFLCRHFQDLSAEYKQRLCDASTPSVRTTIWT
jgi:hypothetical protein